jgi:2-oxoglutarate ferredoxin oxidoreductase subunit gamma
MVIISDKEIGSPYVDKADSLIIMNAPSFERFRLRVKKKGRWIINSSLVKSDKVKGGLTLQHPFTDLAIGLGNIKVANILALGCFIGQSKIVSPKTISGVIRDFVPAGKEELARINQQALEKGVGLK